MSALHLLALAISLALVAATVVKRRALDGHRRGAVLFVAVALGLYAAGGLLNLPSPEEVIRRVAETLGQWTYLVVGLLAFLETGAFIGLIAPGEAAVVAGGVIAGQGQIELNLLIPLVWAAAFLGDTLSFILGAKLGRGFILRHGPRVKITRERLEWVEGYLESHGGKTILVGRFVGLVRALAPFIAGASKMPYRRFLPFDVLGSGLWAATFCVLGYVFWHSFDQVLAYAQRATLIFGWFIGLVVLTIVLVRHFRDPANRAAFERRLDALQDRRALGPPIRAARRAWRPLKAVAIALWPRVRFALNRFTPGDLGIEFTTAAAVAAVSVYGFVFYVSAALNRGAHLAVERADREAFRLAGLIRNDAFDNVAEVVTTAGALSVVASVATAAVVFLLWRRRLAEALVVAAGLALTVLVVQVTKGEVGLVRPDGALVATDGGSFPSGHAAYAVTYIALSIAIERVGGAVGRIALVTTATALAVAVGLSRVYLRAHYLSDVVGGVAAAFAISALLACLALVVQHLRAARRAAKSSSTDVGDAITATTPAGD